LLGLAGGAGIRGLDKSDVVLLPDDNFIGVGLW